MPSSIKTTAIFLQPFELQGLDEVLQAGEYEIETELLGPVDWIEQGSWASSVLVHLQARVSHPGLSRTLTVPLAEFDRAMAKDKLTGKALTEYFLEEMLADPMIRLLMQADGVSETEVRGFYSKGTRKDAGNDDPAHAVGTATQDGGEPGISPDAGSARRPGIGE